VGGAAVVPGGAGPRCQRRRRPPSSAGPNVLAPRVLDPVKVRRVRERVGLPVLREGRRDDPHQVAPAQVLSDPPAAGMVERHPEPVAPVQAERGVGPDGPALGGSHRHVRQVVVHSYPRRRRRCC
jgi:hypothetical protein